MSVCGDRRDGRYDSLCKIILVGDSGSGKSCFLMRYAEDVYTESHPSTIGVDFKVKTIRHSGQTVRLQMWDTAGQDRFRSIVSAYYRGADGVLLLCDVSSRESLHSTSMWARELIRYAKPSVPCIVVGNKSDGPRTFTLKEAQHHATNIGFAYMEASSKSGEGVQLVFNELVHNILMQRIEQEASEVDSFLIESDVPPLKCINCKLG